MSCKWIVLWLSVVILALGGCGAAEDKSMSSRPPGDDETRYTGPDWDDDHGESVGEPSSEAESQPATDDPGSPTILPPANELSEPPQPIAEPRSSAPSTTSGATPDPFGLNSGPSRGPSAPTTSPGLNPPERASNDDPLGIRGIRSGLRTRELPATGGSEPQPEAVRSMSAPKAAELENPPTAAAMRMSAEPPEADEPKVASADSATTVIENDDEDFARVQVFYATDREPLGAQAVTWKTYARKFYVAGIVAAATILALLACPLLYKQGTRNLLVGSGLAATLVSAFFGFQACMRIQHVQKYALREYGNRRNPADTYELGTCEVSIPRQHEVGEIEAPSILRLEVRENPERHVVLLDTTQMEDDPYFNRMRETLDRSSQRNVFVFVHGFNVSFEAAAQRTAQIAYDLKFQGAPVFYSWPSQGGLLEYTVDEDNVEWAVPHLRDFLLEVVERSGANTVSLIAHSMGNRALTSALRQLSYRMPEEPMFRDVILTAPDIDAQIFKRDIAPRVVKTADRVTLYASSNDEALKFSKKINGHSRAGDSGEDLIVMPGLDTVDVSAVDTSLLGHSYYGSSGSVLQDLVSLLNDSSPPEQRHWLRAVTQDGLKYWTLLQTDTASASGAIR